MSKKIKIAFDLGNNSLKIVALRNGKADFHELGLPANLMEEDTITMPNAFSAFLKQAKKDLRLPKGPAALLLPSSKVICRLVSMPYMSEDQLLLNLPYEFSEFINGETHQYHCDYAICEELTKDEDNTPSELTMMAAAVEKKQIQSYIQMFSSGGFSLKRILPQEMALIQLVKNYRTKKSDAPKEYCFIDLGYLSTRIFMVQDNKIQVTRRIPLGCRDLDMVAADILNIDQLLTDSYKRGNHQGILENPRCLELYENIAVEALKLVNFYHFTYRQNQLSGVYLIGGGANIRPLSNILEETLGLPILSIADLMPNEEDKKQNKGDFACAVGLILDSKEEG